MRIMEVRRQVLLFLRGDKCFQYHYDDQSLERIVERK